MKRSRYCLLKPPIKNFLLFFNLGFGKILGAEKLQQHDGCILYKFQILYTSNLHYIQIWQPAYQHILIILNYVHTYVPLYIIKVFSLHNFLNYNTCTMSGQILLCSKVLRTCTWKIVFKLENNELNELSECMLFIKRFFFRKTSQKCKTLFYNYFPEAFICFSSF